MPSPPHFGGKHDPTVGQEAIVFSSDCPPRLRPSLKITQLDAQNRSLQTLHAVVVSAQQVMIFAILSPVAQHANLLRVIRIAGSDRPTLAVGAQIFGGIKTEAAQIADTACVVPVILRG